jgi:hypothetical protein
MTVSTTAFKPVAPVASKSYKVMEPDATLFKDSPKEMFRYTIGSSEDIFF